MTDHMSIGATGLAVLWELLPAVADAEGRRALASVLAEVASIAFKNNRNNCTAPQNRALRGWGWGRGSSKGRGVHVPACERGP